MLTLLLILFVIGGLIMFVHKVVMKSIMQKKLGRKVEDRELTSISAWMEDGPDRNQPPR